MISIEEWCKNCKNNDLFIYQSVTKEDTDTERHTRGLEEENINSPEAPRGTKRLDLFPTTLAGPRGTEQSTHDQCGQWSWSWNGNHNRGEDRMKTPSSGFIINKSNQPYKYLNNIPFEYNYAQEVEVQRTKTFVLWKWQTQNNFTSFTYNWYQLISTHDRYQNMNATDPVGQ